MQNFSPSLFLTSLQGITPSLILITILSVSLLHSALMSRPSYLAGKGEELRIQKTQTYTTWWHTLPVNIMKPSQPPTTSILFFDVGTL